MPPPPQVGQDLLTESESGTEAALRDMCECLSVTLNPDPSISEIGKSDFGEVVQISELTHIVAPGTPREISACLCH